MGLSTGAEALFAETLLLLGGAIVAPTDRGVYIGIARSF